MNYYGARQRESDQRWDFTCKNDDRIWPVGYCHEYREWTAARLSWVRDEAEAAAQAVRLEAEQAPLRDKYHADGHATADEADRCFYDYQLDHLRPLEFSGAQYPCAVCGAWSQQGLEAEQLSDAILCADHANREGYAQARPFHAGISVVSSD